jgi:hypothetical protein
MKERRSQQNQEQLAISQILVEERISGREAAKLLLANCHCFPFFHNPLVYTALIYGFR